MKKLVCVALLILLLLSSVAFGEEAFEVGSIITFGHYKQSYNPLKATDPIEWIVLDCYPNDNIALLLSKDVIEARPFHSSEPFPTWAQSDIRNWLNSTFLDVAFTQEERNAIYLVPIQTADYEGLDGGEDTEDYVFLLSDAELKMFFNERDSRVATPTKYASSLGAEPDGSNGCCSWWLRDPGFDTDVGAHVAYNGNSRTMGGHSPTSIMGIRPTIWINIELISQTDGE